MLDTLYAFLAQVFEPFRFLKHARERRLQEKQEAHENLVDLIDTMMGRVERIIEHQKEAQIAAAHSNGKLAEGIVLWLEMFKTSAEAQANLGTATVRSEDEASEERSRELEALKKKGFPVNGSNAEKLQWILENEEL
jgi:hypothetical protein